MDAVNRHLAGHAPAKINLALHVTGRRADGYHLLESLAVFTGLGDSLSVAPAPLDDLCVTGHFAASVPIGGGNLVIKARDALRAAFPDAETPPVAIALTKNLPVASGIGGGSSDAAAALRELARLWRLDADAAALSRFGLTLGADVPMCLAGRPLIARGIGERIEPVAGFPALPMVLVNPRIEISTPAVFSALASRENAGLPPLPLHEEPPLSSVIDWLQATRNDLEPPALAIEPVVGDVLTALTTAGAAFARMSGSGATCFGIFDDTAPAESAAAEISKQQPHWFVAATSSMASPEVN